MKTGEAKLKQFRPRPKPVRKLLGYANLLLCSTLANTKVRGRHHIPESGPFIVAGNHFSLIDPPFMMYAMNKPMIILMAADQELDWYFMWAPWLYGFIPTHRKSLAPSTIKMAVNALQSGEIMGIYPEGTSMDEVLRPAKNGAAYLSTAATVPIVPIGVVGLKDAWPNLFRGIRPRVKVRIGKPCGPFTLPQEKEMRKPALVSIGDEIMCRIAALLPEKYHGAFEGRPEIEEYRKDSGY